MTFGGNWDGKERRQENREVVDCLNRMDKNLALLTQSTTALTSAFNTHVIHDERIQEELKKEVGAIKVSLAKYAGGIAVAVLVINLAVKAWR